MPAVRVQSLVGLFFPSSGSRRSRRPSRAHAQSVNISGGSGANIHPSVFMSTTPSGAAPSMVAGHHHLPCGYRHGLRSMSVGGADGLPGFGSLSHSQRDTPFYFAAGMDDGYLPTTPSPQVHHSVRNMNQPGYDDAPGPRRNTGRRRHFERPNRNNNDDHGRLSAYTNVMLQAPTCFVGNSPLTAGDPNFYDQTIRFRVIDCTEHDQGRGGVQTEREMIVLSSPGNVMSVLQTMAPGGSGRRIVVRALDANGVRQQGDPAFLAYTVLRHGWPFDIVIEED